jgi:hypothetical protein
VAKKEEKEEVLETPEPKPDPLDKLREELSGMQDRLSKTENQAKELGSKLTKAQQENAELVRFHKATLPKINKSFEDRWEESPETAVHQEIETRMAPVADQATKLSAELALTRIIAKNPSWGEYEDRVRELGEEFPEITYKGERGIMRLFQMVHAEKMDAKAKPKNGEDMDKTKAITEEPSAKASEQTTGKTRLNSDQLLICRKLGIKPEEYAKHMKEAEVVG